MTQQSTGLPRTTCISCGAHLPEAGQYCPHCGTKQADDAGTTQSGTKQADGAGTTQSGTKQADGAGTTQSGGKQLSLSTLLAIGTAVALALGGVSFGITRAVLPDPAPPQEAAHQHPQEQQQKPAITPEQEATRKQMGDSLIANPNDADLTLRFANFLYDIAEYESAADFYNRYIIRFDSTNPDAYVDYGHTLFRTGKHEEAVQMTKRALSYAPTHQAALFNLGVMSVQMQDRQGAIEWFNLCAQADSTTALGQQARQVIQQIHNMSSSN